MECYNNDYLIILGAARDQIPAYQRASYLGIKTIGVDYNPKSPAFDYCDINLIASIKHEDQLISALDTLANDVNYIGVMTLGVEISPMVSIVAERYGLVSVDYTTAMVTTNKCLRNLRLTECIDVNIPKYQIVKSFWAITLSYPFVIKPSDSSASRGVRRVDQASDLPNAFNEAMKHSSDGRVLVEELIDGQQISIEGFMHCGKMHVTGFADRNYQTIPNTPTQPLFIEDGSNSPSMISNELYTKACTMFESAALACGITDGPSKGDLIINDDVYVIEITSRLSGGGFCSRIQPLQNGTDIVTATIQWHCKMDVDLELLTKKFNKPVVHRFYFHKPGKIKAIRGIDSIMSNEGIRWYVEQYPFKVGDTLQELTYINRLFYIITTGDTLDQAITNAERIIKSVKINT